jgi:hypothetical protein
MNRTRAWVVLVVLTAVVALVQLPGPHATAWHFFDEAARLLIGRGPSGEAGGLRLYADRPDLQFGPLSILLAVPFALLGETVGQWAAMVVTAGAGLAAYALILSGVECLLPSGRRVADSAMLFGGVLAVITWGDIAIRTAHIDDAVALVGLAAALRWCALDRARPATLALAVAAAAKPWALMFVPLALVPSGHHRGRRMVLVGLVVAATWVPFVLADSATLDVGDFRIINDPTSVLRALGIDDPTTPLWVRPLQVVGGFLVVAAVVLRGRWPAALACGLAWRLLLEPGAHRYYTVGVVLALLFVELRARPNRVPMATAISALVLELTALPDAPDRLGSLARLAIVVFIPIAAWQLADRGVPVHERDRSGNVE